jgi:hypothetical protein
VKAQQNFGAADSTGAAVAEDVDRPLTPVNPSAVPAEQGEEKAVSQPTPSAVAAAEATIVAAAAISEARAALEQAAAAAVQAAEPEGQQPSSQGDGVGQEQAPSEAAAAGAVPASQTATEAIEAATRDLVEAQVTALRAFLATPPDVLLSSYEQLAASSSGPSSAGSPVVGPLPPARFLPRGFINTGNSCFVNSPLQALLGCGPFCALLAHVRSLLPALDPTQVPTLWALASLVSEFELAPPPAPPGLEPAGSIAAGSEGSGSGEQSLAGGWSEVKKSKKGRGTLLSSNALHGSANVAKQASGTLPNGTTATHSPSSSISGGAPGSGSATAAGMGMVMGGRPVVPSALNDVIRKFSPRYAAMAAAQASGTLNMAQRLALKSGRVGCPRRQ